MIDINIDRTKIDFKIDEEFSDYLPSLTDTEYKKLKDSIEREGLHDPLIVWEEEKILVDGHHRLMACQELDINPEIEYKSFIFRAQVIAWIIENNWGRRNLTPEQKNILLGELYLNSKKDKTKNLKKGDKPPKGKSYPSERTSEVIAKDYKVSEKTVRNGQDLVIAINSIAKNVDKNFRSKVINKESNISQQDIIDIEEKYEPEKQKTIIKKLENKEFDNLYMVEREMEKEKRKIEIEKKSKKFDESNNKVKVYHGDLKKVCANFNDNSIDHIITDPPYPKEFLSEWEKLSKIASRILKPSGFCITYSGKSHLPEVINILNENLDYYWQAILIHKGLPAGVHDVKINTKYKPILIFQKSPHKNQHDYVTDIIQGTGQEKDLHEWQQGEEEMTEILEKFTEPNDLILDPFAGSGTTLIGCLKNNRRCIGIDKDKENIKIIKRRITDESDEFI